MPEVPDVSVVATVPGVSGERDDDLLTLMSWHEHPSSARAAWAEFYQRHSRFLYGQCKRVYGERLDVEDLVAETFMRAFKRAATFHPDASRDRLRMRLQVRAWLAQIAKRLAQDMLRGPQRCRATSQLFSDDVEVPTNSTTREDVGDWRVAILQEALATVLSEDQREVLRVTMQFYDPTRVNQRLPNDDSPVRTPAS